jgi:hypothetical protein
MSTKFVQFTQVHHNEPILINTDHVRTAAAVSGRNNTVKLVMEQDHFVEVVGDLHSVQEKLTGEKLAP